MGGASIIYAMARARARIRIGRRAARRVISPPNSSMSWCGRICARCCTSQPHSQRRSTVPMEERRCPQELLARRETLRRGQAHLRQQIERLTDAYLRAIIPLDEYERRRSDLERRMQALAGQEALLRNDAARPHELAGVAASLEAFRARVQRGLAEADFERRRQLVMLLIDRVVVTDADVEIRYVLPITPESEHVRFCQLRKDYFDNPALWQHLKGMEVRAFDDFEDVAEHGLAPIDDALFV